MSCHVMLGRVGAGAASRVGGVLRDLQRRVLFAEHRKMSTCELIVQTPTDSQSSLLLRNPQLNSFMSCK